MRKVERLARSQQRLHLRPDLLLVGIRKQVHDNSTLLDGVQHREQVLARNPAFLNSLLESTTLTLTNNDIDAIVAQVQGLTTTLRSVTKHSNRVVLERLQKLLAGNIRSLVYGFFDATKVQRLVAANLSRNSLLKTHRGKESVYMEREAIRVPGVSLTLTAVCFKAEETGRAIEGRAATMARREAARRATAKTLEDMIKS